VIVWPEIDSETKELLALLKLRAFQSMWSCRSMTKVVKERIEVGVGVDGDNKPLNLRR
jgi:hypothetical protein